MEVRWRYYSACRYIEDKQYARAGFINDNLNKYYYQLIKRRNETTLVYMTYHFKTTSYYHSLHFTFRKWLLVPRLVVVVHLTFKFPHPRCIQLVLQKADYSISAVNSMVPAPKSNMVMVVIYSLLILKVKLINQKSTSTFSVSPCSQHVVRFYYLDYHQRMNHQLRMSDHHVMNTNDEGDHR